MIGTSRGLSTEGPWYLDSYRKHGELGVLLRALTVFEGVTHAVEIGWFKGGYEIAWCEVIDGKPKAGGQRRFSLSDGIRVFALQFVKAPDSVDYCYGQRASKKMRAAWEGGIAKGIARGKQREAINSFEAIVEML